MACRVSGARDDGLRAARQGGSGRPSVSRHGFGASPAMA
jgi:hypothetical protein